MSTTRIAGSPSSSSSVPLECETQPLSTTTAGPSPRPPPAAEGHSLEAFRDHATGWETPPLSHAQAERREQNAAATTLREGVEQPLADLARRYPDPVDGATNRGVRSSELMGGAFGQAFVSGPVAQAAATLPREVAETVVWAQVNRAWPGLPPESIDQLTAMFMKAADDQLRNHTAFALRQTAVDTMTAASKDLAALAKDPSAMQELTATLDALSGPRATPAQHQQAQDLRESLGLDSPTPLKVPTPDVLAERIGARANLVQDQATRLAHTGANRVASELLGLDVGEQFLRGAKVKEGSWAAEQVKAVEGQGHFDQEFLEAVKTATSVTMSMTTTALGVPAVGSAVISAAFSSMDLAKAERRVERAGAGESSGIMAPGARRHAEAELASVKAQATFKAVLGGAAGSLTAAPAADLMGHVLGHEVAHVVAHGAAHWLVDGALEELSELALGEGPEGASGLNGAQRASLAMGVRMLQSRPGAQEALQGAMDQEGLPDDAARGEALQSFLASQGRTLRRLDDAAIAGAFGQFLQTRREA